MSQDLYEVYVAYDKQGNPLYVGQGAKGRHKHCTSGKYTQDISLCRLRGETNEN